MTSPNTGIPYVPEGTLDPAAGLNLAIDHIDALLQCAVLSMALTAPPGGESDGDLYIVASPAAGDWVGQENNLARYVAEGDFWQFFVAGVQVHLVLNRDDLGLYRFDGGSSPGSWALAAGLGDAPIDGTLYARRDGAWEAAGSSMTVIEVDDSPPTVFLEVETIQVGEGIVATEVSPGIVLLEASGGGGSAENGHAPLTTLAIVANVVTLDHSAGADFVLELDDDVTTFTHTNITAGQANWFTMEVAQDGTGGHDFDPPASWRYGSGVAAYTPSLGAGDRDLVQGISYDDGASWLISYVKDFT